MMAQYRRIKGELPKDALLLFRLGDFYEMFFEDAQTGAQVLNVTLTRRGEIPMCGIPHHSAPSYISRLLRRGHKVAICDQMEDARPGQLVKREVTQILSPGTHFDERVLVAERNNYLASVCLQDGVFGLAVVDLTTGDFKATELSSEPALMAELDRLRPAETVIPSESARLRALLDNRVPALSGYEDWAFGPETAVFTVREHFKVASLDGFGLRNRPAAIGAVGGALHYLGHHLRRDLSHLMRLSAYQVADYLVLDSTTLRHLEILEPLHRDADRACTLFGALNKTITPMGARRLRDWLSQPLANAHAIRSRQAVVARFQGAPELLEQVRAALREVRDLERTLGRLTAGSGNARDLLGLRQGLEPLPALRQLLDQTIASARQGEDPGSLVTSRDPAALGLLQQLTQEIIPQPALVELIARAIVEAPPLSVKEGNLIREGFDPALDELRQGAREGKDWVAKLQQDEIERTGIASLKVRFNSVFGYFIEVTKANLEKVPAHYIRKQTIANGERFITPELKEVEGRILGAEERSIKLEHELFLKVREEVLTWLRPLQETAAALAQLDVLAGFADAARARDYCRPEVGEEGLLRIEEGRHPVLEQALTEERFVPNDTMLALGGPQVALITGPNMAGKSTYLRQVALLAVLAHTGSFVPARTARIDLLDRVFTRIGASDDLSRGQSTFMVEMSETANILNNATTRSLIVLDEIGRGTSTFDGLSLAWSIVEHLHNAVGAKTLFATHYHELTELAQRLPRLKNYNVAVREWNDQIVFLRKIVEGGTDKSYGIQVARLAGVPKTVVERAKQILVNLEESELTPEGNVRAPARQRVERDRLQRLAASSQLDLFAVAALPSTASDEGLASGGNDGLQ
ncbi:MAG: DNA mismatch repair protein MutS [Verrucomicrobia bacterium]|nr:DNA mismatch repair protein MutS [Verrucomicrobiota bacterium]MBI3869961.1 DNA mismatch repair protein MutS [Verrucomicrobiota bacterium]